VTDRVLLRGGQVLTPTADRFRRADVLIEAGRIAAIQPHLEPRSGVATLDLHDDLLIPGLIDAHYHSPDNLNTGVLPEAPLELWSLASVPARGSSPELLQLAVRLGAAQLLRGGVTGVVDMVRPWPALTPAALDAVAEAYLGTGMRVAIAPVVRDLPVVQTLPLDRAVQGRDEPAVDPAEQLQIIEAFFGQWHGRGDRIQVHVGPSAPQRCSDALLDGAFELARRLCTIVHTHALETRAQAEQARRRWGRSLLRHLAASGALGPTTVLAHLVWPESDEPDLLADRGAIVVHNPTSNLALGSGRAPLPDLLAAGVTLALGTDAATCNDGLSMFDSMKLATIVHRPDTPDWRRWPSASDALRLATGGGAAALGLPHDLGRIDVGYLADLVVLDVRHPALLPLNTPVRQVVMRGGPDLVRHVLIGGQLVVRERQFVDLDWDAIVREATALTARRSASAVDDPLAAPIERMLADLRGSGVLNEAAS
jgi:cytosine/adenosine deaminase-related metal-dependent hydrolase